MKLQAKQFRAAIIEPVLRHMGLESEAAIRLLLGTAATESHLGYYFLQVGGPALGPYQIEPVTLKDVLHRTQKKYPDLYQKALDFTVPNAPHNHQLVWNWAWATCCARLKYYLAKPPLPAPDDFQGLAAYYKKHFNTAGGKGSVEEFLKDYDRYVGK